VCQCPMSGSRLCTLTRVHARVCYYTVSMPYVGLTSLYDVKNIAAFVGKVRVNALCRAHVSVRCFAFLCADCLLCVNALCRAHVSAQGRIMFNFINNTGVNALCRAHVSARCVN